MYLNTSPLRHANVPYLVYSSGHIWHPVVPQWSVRVYSWSFAGNMRPGSNPSRHSSGSPNCWWEHMGGFPLSQGFMEVLGLTKAVERLLGWISNPGSKPLILGATNCKSSTSDKLQTFKTIFGISCKFMTKNYLHKITRFVFKRNLMQEKSQNLSGK